MPVVKPSTNLCNFICINPKEDFEIGKQVRDFQQFISSCSATIEDFSKIHPDYKTELSEIVNLSRKVGEGLNHFLDQRRNRARFFALIILAVNS